MAYEIVMPQLSDSMEEGKLIGWRVKPGDRVHAGDVIAEVESDKAIMEVQTFRDGVVERLELQEGESAPVGTVIALIRTDGQKRGSAPSGSGRQEAPGPSPSVSESTRAGESPRSSGEPRTVSAEGAKSAAGRGSVEELFGADRPTETHVSAPEGRASPRARALAAKVGVDIADLQERGELPVPVHESELRDYYERRYFTPKALATLRRYHLPTDLFAKGKKHDLSEVEAYIRDHAIPLPVPLDPMRKAIVATVTESARRPVFHIYDAIDAALLISHETKERTVTVWMVKLLGMAMMRHDPFRTTLGEKGLQVWPAASVSVAIAVEGGLYMPVVRNVDTLPVDRIAEILTDLRERAKRRAIRPEEFEGSTFGLSNLGMTGIERFDAMIYGKDMGIAAVGAESNGRIAVTLTCDHRIVDGYEAARFMQTLKSLALDSTLFKSGE